MRTLDNEQPLSLYSGRTVVVGKYDKQSQSSQLDKSWKRLNGILARNDVRRELILRDRYEVIKLFERECRGNIAKNMSCSEVASGSEEQVRRIRTHLLLALAPVLLYKITVVHLVLLGCLSSALNL